VNSGTTYYKNKNGAISYRTNARSNVELRNVVVGEDGDYFIVKPDPLVNENLDYVSAPRGVMNSQADNNNPDYTIYKTSQQKSDIRDTSSRFYIYQRTTGSYYGEYGYVVDNNNRNVYVKKSDVISLHGKKFESVVEDNSLKVVRADTKRISLNNDTLNVELLAANYSHTTGKTSVLNVDSFNAYLENENGHIINSIGKPVLKNGSYLDFRYYNIGFDYKQLQSNTTYTIKVLGTSEQYDKTPANTYLSKGTTGLISNSKDLFYTPGNEEIGRFFVKKVEKRISTSGDFKGARVNGNTLTLSNLLAYVDLNTGERIVIDQVKFKVSLINENNHVVEATKAPTKVNGAYNNHRYFESTFDVSQLQLGTTYTIYIATTDETNTFKNKEVLYLYRGVSGNIAGSNYIKYDSSNEVAKLKVVKTEKKISTSGDFKGARINGNTLTLSSLLAYVDLNTGERIVIDQVKFKISLINENNHVVEAIKDPYKV
ncbi:MAG: hypothetical protein ACRCTA_01205, partial [Bacilli bacterium]